MCKNIKKIIIRRNKKLSNNKTENRENEANDIFS